MCNLEILRYFREVKEDKRQNEAWEHSTLRAPLIFEANKRRFKNLLSTHFQFSL
jgi:hypothetical protein